MQNASEPSPLLTGSTIVITAAVAMAASTAFPPRASMRWPACAATGCEVETMLRPNTGRRRLGYPACQSKNVCVLIDPILGAASHVILHLPVLPPDAPPHRRGDDRDRGRHG